MLLYRLHYKHEPHSEGKLVRPNISVRSDSTVGKRGRRASRVLCQLLTRCLWMERRQTTKHNKALCMLTVMRFFFPHYTNTPYLTKKFKLKKQ